MNDKQNSNSFESADDFEARIFSKTSEGNSKTDSFFAKLDRLGKTRDGYASNLPGGSGRSFHVLDGLDESFNTLSDGMDGKLKKAAMYFEYDPEEVDMDGYAFRPDTRFHLGGTYELKVCKGASDLFVYSFCTFLLLSLLLLLVLICSVITCF